MTTPAIAVMTTIGKKIRGALKMSADDVFFWANWALVAALVLGVLATYAVVVSGNIRDENLKRELAEQSARSAQLEKDTT